MSKFQSANEYLTYSMEVISQFQALRAVKGNAVNIEASVRKFIPEARLCLSVTYIPYGIDMAVRTVYLNTDIISDHGFARGKDEFTAETLADYELLINYKDDELLLDVVMSTLDDVQELIFVSLALRAKIEYDETVMVVYMDNSELLESLEGTKTTGSVDVTDLEVDAFLDYIATKE